jgi:hypothetical protein
LLRVLIGTTTAPTLCAPIAASTHSATFGAQIATRSPGAMPAARNARAVRQPAAPSSANEKRTSPSAIAGRAP